MDQLQRLAETIAETYIRDLKRSTGSNEVINHGIIGVINKDLLASGLVDNAISAMKDMRQSDDFVRGAYEALLEMISFIGPEYQLTDHGRNVIETATRNSMAKNKKPTIN